MGSRGVHVETHGTISKAVVLQKFYIWSLIKSYLMNFSLKLCLDPAPALQKFEKFVFFWFFSNIFTYRVLIKNRSSYFNHIGVTSMHANFQGDTMFFSPCAGSIFNHCAFFPILQISGARSSKQDRDLKFFVEAYYVCIIII